MSRVRRAIVLAVVALLIMSNISALAQTQDDFATPAGATPVPIPPQGTPLASPAAPDESSRPTCFEEKCDGADPNLTRCDMAENGVYHQGDPVVVKDDQEHTLGTLQLVANHEGCGSAQWVLFVPEVAFTFALRVHQNKTGLATAWQPYPDRRERAWSTMMHSPNERVRGELAVPDGQGGWTVIAVTASF